MDVLPSLTEPSFVSFLVEKDSRKSDLVFYMEKNGAIGLTLPNPSINLELSCYRTFIMAFDRTMKNTALISFLIPNSQPGAALLGLK